MKKISACMALGAARIAFNTRTTLRAIGMTALIAGYGLANAQSPQDYKWLKLKTRSNAKSAYLVYTDWDRGGVAECYYNLKPNTWNDLGRRAEESTSMSVQEFTSTNCSSGGLGKQNKGVPRDTLTYFWISY